MYKCNYGKNIEYVYTEVILYIKICKVLINSVLRIYILANM